MSPGETFNLQELAAAPVKIVLVETCNHPAWACWMSEFQGLIAGILAVIAAALTAWVVWRSARHSAEATRDAAGLQTEATRDASNQQYKAAMATTEHQAAITREQISAAEKEVLARERRAALRERAQLAGAYMGELAGLTILVENRKIAEGYRRNAEEIRNGTTNDLLKFPLTQNYFEVYRSSSSRLGVFTGDLPEMISAFYTLASGMVDALKAAYQGFYDKTPQDHRVETAEGLAREVDELEGLADELTGRLNAERQATLALLDRIDVVGEPEL